MGFTHQMPINDASASAVTPPKNKFDGTKRPVGSGRF
jgi:hypothetical protein